MAVDPGDDTALENPQSWNRFAYVRNNPIAYRDPNGESAIAATAPVAAVLSQLDSPLPGPMDLIAAGVLAGAIAVDLAIHLADKIKKENIGHTEWEHLTDEQFVALVEALRKAGELTEELKRKIREEEKWRQIRRSRHKRDIVPPEPDDERTQSHDPEGGIKTEPKGPMQRIQLPSEPKEEIRITCSCEKCC